MRLKCPMDQRNVVKGSDGKRFLLGGKGGGGSDRKESQELAAGKM